MSKNTYILPLLFAAMAVSCTDDLYDGYGTIDDGKRSKMTLEFDTNVLQPGLRTRAEKDDVKSLWVGVYDITTGNRIGYNPKEGASIANTVQVVYYDAHPTVVVVGVANYDGVTNNNNESLQDLLNAAETWADLRNIDINVSTIDNENSPLMMGYVGATSNNPTIGLGDNNSIYIDGNSAANSVYQVKLLEGNVDNSNFFQEEIKRNIGQIQLVPLISTINVEVVEGNGIEVSEVKYKFGNVPEGVYLAERPSYTGDGKTYNNFVQQTPNYADTQMTKSGVITKRPAYFNWEDWNNAEGKSFNYSHYENKHRAYYYNSTDERFTGIDNSSVYQKREASWGKGNGDLMQDDDMLKALCNDNQNEYNNFASYFVVNMKVVDHNTGSSGVVSYVVHEGNCNDVNGKAASDPQDYSCFRNMNYNYTLKVNGLKSIEVNVDREDGMHNDGISGNLNSVIEDDPEALKLPEALTTGWNFRFYVSPDANSGVALDYVTDASLKDLDGFYWPAVAATNSDIKEIDKFITISEGGNTFSLSEFVSQFDNTKTYKVEFKDQSDLGTVDNPQDYMIAMYCYHPQDIETDEDGCTTLNKMHRCAGFPESIVKEKLGTPNSLQSYTEYDYITPSITVTVPILSGTSAQPNTDYVYVVNYGGNKSQEMNYSGSNFTYVIPISELPHGTSNYTVYAKAVSKPYTDGAVSNAGTITLTDVDWNFKNSEWGNILTNINNYQTNFNYSLNGLNIMTDSNKMTADKSNGFVYTEGSGNTTRRNFNFKLFKDCKINTWTSSNGTAAETDDSKRNVVVNIEGTTTMKFGGNGSGNQSKNTFNTNDIKEVSTDGSNVYLYSNNSGMRFYRISLSE